MDGDSSRSPAHSNEPDTPTLPLQTSSSKPNRSYTDAQFYEPIGFGQFGRYMRNKRQKLMVQQHEVLENEKSLGRSYPPIFEGLTIYLNGDSPVSTAQLSRLVTVHGGTWLAYLDKKSVVTHILASNLTPKKREEFRSYKVVLPSWILDSVEQGKLLDWRLYRLGAADNNIQRPVEGRSNASSDFTDPTGSPSKQRSLFHMVNSVGPSSEAAESAAAVNASTPSEDDSSSDYDQGTDPAEPHAARKAMSHAYYPHRSNKRAAPLVADREWRLKNTAANPAFVENYFKQSRLHFLSFSKAKLPAMVARISEDLGLSKPNRSLQQKKHRSLTGTADDNRVIWHVDMDCFFVSVGLSSRPHLRGKPVAVCAARDGQRDDAISTSEVSSCSYEAREFGIRNGMSLHRAKTLCPDLCTIPYDFEKYTAVSEEVYRVLMRNSDVLQPVSVDEAFLDVSSRVSTISNFYSPDPDSVAEFAKQIRREIKEATGCEASIGSGPNMLVARLATRKAKPAGVAHISANEISDFLGPHQIDDLPGVGYRITQKFEEALDVKTVSDLLKCQKSRLQEIFGVNQGETFYNFARGVDARPLVTEAPARKSVSADINYGIRLETPEETQAFMKELGKEVSLRLKDLRLRGSHLTLSFMTRLPEITGEPPKFLGHGPCHTHTRIQELSSATDDAELIADVAWNLLKSCNIAYNDLRGVGIQMQKLKKFEVRTDGKLSSQRMLNFKVNKKSTVKGTGCGKTKKTETSNSNIIVEKDDLLSDSDLTLGGSEEVHNKPLFNEEDDDGEGISDNSVEEGKEKNLGADQFESPQSEILVLGDSPMQPPSTTESEKVVPPSSKTLFQTLQAPTASQIDTETFNALPKSIQTEIKEAMEKGKDVSSGNRSGNRELESPSEMSPIKKRKAKERQNNLITDSMTLSKPFSRQAKISNKGNLVVPEVPKQFERRGFISGPPSPSRITDDQLEKMGISDKIVFRSLPRNLKKDVLSTSWNDMDDSARKCIFSNDNMEDGKNQNVAGVGTGMGEKRAPTDELISIFGQKDVEKIRDSLENWIEAKAEEGPHQNDVDHLMVGILGILGQSDKSKGRDVRQVQDLAKVSSILSWLKYLVERETLKAKSLPSNEYMFNLSDWNSMLQNVTEKVDDVVLRSHGGRFR